MLCYAFTFTKKWLITGQVLQLIKISQFQMLDIVLQQQKPASGLWETTHIGFIPCKILMW